jgi:hypothetical protein
MQAVVAYVDQGKVRSTWLWGMPFLTATTVPPFLSG